MLTCGDCNCFRVENPEPVAFENRRMIEIYNGICLCHGYHLRSNEEICVDFERGVGHETFSDKSREKKLWRAKK